MVLVLSVCKMDFCHKDFDGVYIIIYRYEYCI